MLNHGIINEVWSELNNSKNMSNSIKLNLKRTLNGLVGRGFRLEDINMPLTALCTDPLVRHSRLRQDTKFFITFFFIKI